MSHTAHFPTCGDNCFVAGGHAGEAGVWEVEQKGQGERDGASSSPLTPFLDPQPEGPQ